MCLSKAAQFLSRIVDPVSRVMNGIGGVILAMMMFLTAADVILRYIFKSPLTSSYELTQLMMVILITFGLAYVGVRKEHIRIDFIISRFSPRVQDFVFSITTILSIGILVLISWRSIIYAEILKANGGTTAALHIPLFPFAWVVAVGSAVLTVVLIMDLFNYLAQLLARGQWWLRAGLLLGVVLVSLLFAVPALGEVIPLQMNPITIGFIAICALIVLLFLGMHIGTVLGLVGFLGMANVSGLNAGLTMTGVSSFSTVASYDYSVIPMFILMGVFCFKSGLIRDFYATMHKWLGHLPGGLAMATIGGCAGFAAVCGSSTATAATLGTVALPEMRRYKYDPGLATGVIAAGGSIGSMIPPSIIFIMYAVLTEQSIGKMFLAGFIPGIMQAIFYIITIYIICKRNPILGPPAERVNFTEKVISLKGTWGVLVLFLLVIGGIYAGVFTVIEAAGIGAFGSFLFLLVRKTFSWKIFGDSLAETTQTTAMCFLMLIGTMFFNYLLAVSRLPFEISNLVSAMAVNRYIILAIIIVIYLFLGCILSGFAIVMLTVPIFFPMISALGFDLIWFGIIVTRMCEIGVITPPVGINVFIITGIAKDIPMSTVFRGIVPFLYADLIQVVFLVAFPEISLFLPNLMQ